jgi:hypothetical protein
MTDDPFESEEWKRYADRAIDELVPMIRDSAVTISVVPDGPGDVKFAVELGFSIMMDKPIIAVVQPGAKVPSRLIAVADEIIEMDPDNPEELMSRLRPILDKVVDKRKGDS